jgi:hypothetical protein
MRHRRQAGHLLPSAAPARFVDPPPLASYRLGPAALATRVIRRGALVVPVRSSGQKMARSRTTCLISDDRVASDGRKASEVGEVVRE